MELLEYDIMAAVEHRHWWYAGMRAITAAWLDPLLFHRRDLRVLDAGCGTGGNGEFLERYGHTVGIDLSPHATELAYRRLPGRVGRASVVELPFAAQSFDLVTSFEVLYHRAVPDVPGALGEVRRVLRPGGYFLLRLPAYQWLWSRHDQAVHARERYTTDQTRALLTAAGFAVVRVSYCNTLLFPAVLAQRLLERWRPTAPTGSALEMPAPAVNSLLRTALDTEAVWFTRAQRLPFGLSVLALAHNP